ncbi:unnamed protein product [Paramecium primaurelia]|uniref:Protein kinase domain-containing protein n=1 Tax=Paramecium primaurelia TaxID=5886 RepID=A0A8S1KK59_PARPR|nr:unnamed protein product [Paramecium primaurelia]
MTIILQNKKGAGTQGAVYQGFIKNNNQQVAIKIVQDLSNRESQILQQIQIQKKKHIISIYAIENLKNQAIVVMELAEMDFYQFMKTNQFKTSDVNERNQLYSQMILGVQEFHNLGYLHRDLKPENFVCCRDQNQNLIIKLIDFGISKIQQINGNQSMNIGTPYYMSREIINNESYTKAIDVWAMGLIWYEILTGQTFFKGNNQLQIMNQICSIRQFQIDQQIDALNMIQNEYKTIMKGMICIDKQKRISIDDAIYKINEFFQEQKIEKIKVDLKIQYEEKEKLIKLENEKKIEEIQNILKLELENEFELKKEQLKFEYNQKIQQKEIELKQINEQKPLIEQNQQNIEEQKLKKELQYQIEMNQYKKNCKLDYQQKIEQIQRQQKEIFEKNKQIEEQEIQKKIKEEFTKLYQIELNKKLQEQQLEAESYQKKEQYHIKKQNYNYIINLLKESIQNAIFDIIEKKQNINDLQIENQDKYSILNSIQKFIKDKEERLSEINKDENIFFTLDESLHFSKFVEFEVKYKNQLQIHIEEKNMIDQEINKFMVSQFKRQEYIAREDKIRQEELQNQQEMKNLNQNQEMLKNQYNQFQIQIENIKTICENYSHYDQNISNNFIRLKQNSNQIALSFNEVQQYYLSLENNVTLDYINLIKLKLQEIHNQLQRLQENIIQVNESISTYEQQLQKQMHSDLTSIQYKSQEIQFKIDNFKKNNYENDDMILNQFQEKQKLMEVYIQKLNTLISIKICDSINEFMQIKQSYAIEEKLITDLSEKLQQKQFSVTKIKIMTQKYQEFYLDVQNCSKQYKQSIEQLESQLNQIEQKSQKLENQQIMYLLKKKQNEINELMKEAQERFDGLLNKRKQNLESQLILNNLKEEYKQIQTEFEEKKQEQMKNIIDLENIFRSEYNSEADQKLQKLQSNFFLLNQEFNQKQIELRNLDIQNYSYKEILDQNEIKKEELQKQIEIIESLEKIFNENQNVTNDFPNHTKLEQNTNFYEQQQKLISLLNDSKQKSEENFKKLQQIKGIINNIQKKIKFFNLQNENSTQEKWIQTYNIVVQLNQDLLNYNKQIQGAQNNNYDQLDQQFLNLKNRVQEIFNQLPQKKDILQFKKNFEINNKSFYNTCLLIILIKGYNIKRYILRLKEFQETQKQKQTKQIDKLNEQIKNEKQNSESTKQYEMELQKIEQKKIIFTKEVKEYEFVVEEIVQKYELQLESKELIIKNEEYYYDEKKLDNYIKEIKNHIITLNTVKMKSNIKDQKFNKDFCNKFLDQLEFCKILGLLEIFKFLNNDQSFIFL